MKPALACISLRCRLTFPAAWLLLALLLAGMSAACNLPIGAGFATPTLVETDACVKCEQLFPTETSAPTPTPTAPAAAQTPSPSAEIAPYVEIAVTPAEVKTGGTFTITGRPVRIGLPYYYLSLAGENGEAQPIAAVTHSNDDKTPPEKNPLFEVTALKGSMNACEFTLKALQPGVYRFTINATGEVHSASGATWAGGSSEAVTLTVK